MRTFYYSQGTQIYCAPTVDARPAWQHTMNHIAIEGRCFVLSACQYAEEKDYPEGHAVADPANKASSNVMIAGGSVIVSPLGKVLAGPLLGKEGVLTADLDLDDIVRGKFDLDVTGHYARPDGKCTNQILLQSYHVLTTRGSIPVRSRFSKRLKPLDLCLIDSGGTQCIVLFHSHTTY